MYSFFTFPHRYSPIIIIIEFYFVLNVKTLTSQNITVWYVQQECTVTIHLLRYFDLASKWDKNILSKQYTAAYLVYIAYVYLYACLK